MIVRQIAGKLIFSISGSLLATGNRASVADSMKADINPAQGLPFSELCGCSPGYKVAVTNFRFHFTA